MADTITVTAAQKDLLIQLIEEQILRHDRDWSTDRIRNNDWMQTAFNGCFAIIAQLDPELVEDFKRTMYRSKGLDLFAPDRPPQPGPATAAAAYPSATETSITPLTTMEHKVIGQYLAGPHPDKVTLYTTSARFVMPPRQAVEFVSGVLAGMTGRGYPRQPMGAVLRKVQAEHDAARERAAT